MKLLLGLIQDVFWPACELCRVTHGFIIVGGLVGGNVRLSSGGHSAVPVHSKVGVAGLAGSTVMRAVFMVFTSLWLALRAGKICKSARSGARPPRTAAFRCGFNHLARLAIAVSYVGLHDSVEIKNSNASYAKSNPRCVKHAPLLVSPLPKS